MGLRDIISNLFKPQQEVPEPVEIQPEPAVVPIPEEIEIPVENDEFAPPSDPDAYRKFRLTYYWLAEQARFSGPRTVPVYDKDGKVLDHVEPAYFAAMSLQGTGKMRDGRLFNVASTWVPVKHQDYAGVYEYHRKYLPRRAGGYSGINIKGDQVASAMAFRIVPESQFGEGYGIIRGIPLKPFRTLAADIGALKSHEPKWKDKGGICPPLTQVFIEEFVGVKLPDGTEHDGWFVVNDTGGGIFGCHFDVFVGTKSLKEKVSIPGTGTVWYKGIDERVPVGYDHGLKDG